MTILLDRRPDGTVEARREPLWVADKCPDDPRALLGTYAASGVGVGGAATFGDVEYANAVNSAPLTFNRSGGTVANSLLVAVLTSNLTATWTSLGSGWTGPIGTAGGGAVFYLLCGGSEPSTYSFSSSASVGTTHRGALVRFEGANLTTPVQNANGAAVSGNGSSPANVATMANSLLFCALLNVGSNTSAVTVPAGMTQIFQTTATAYKAGAILTVPSGPTAAKQWTNPASTSFAVSVVINPAA